jgi:hypothetical protein
MHTTRKSHWTGKHHLRPASSSFARKGKSVTAITRDSDFVPGKRKKAAMMSAICHEPGYRLMLASAFQI